ncbi:MAG: HAD family hydrolase [Burkholderiaceae bacterium]|jgi:HAD superfamily hydrolase (TIGR01490 family)
MPPGSLALFDLDHTLLPLDSDVAWAEALVKRGVVDAQWHRHRNDHFFAQYKAGTLNIGEFLEFQLGPLAAHSRATLESWREEFLANDILPQIRPEARSLVKKHQDEGALCAIVTATNEFITAPIAEVFGIPHLIATLVETDARGEFTGRPRGLPSFREGKVTRVQQWLAEMGLGLESFGTSYFYSDSLNDLPLMAQVSHPVAVNPDPRLAAHAEAQGWPVLSLFASKDNA